MKHLCPKSLLLPVLLLASACTAPNDLSIIVSSARAPGDQCDFLDPTLYVEGGAIDLSASNSYFQVFSWENNLQLIATTVNGDLISGPSVNTFIANRIELSYVLVGGTNPPAGIVNISAAIPPGATPDKASVGVFLLTSEAAASVQASVPPGTGSQTLLVTFQILGSLVGGGAAATNPVTYPLTLFKCGNSLTGFCNAPLPNGTCPAGYAAQTTSCGIPGRDIPYCIAVP